MSKSSLRQQFPQHREIPCLIIVSAAALFFGLWLPVITLKEMVLWHHTFSVVSGISSLLAEKHYFLGIIILFFSVVFPLFKLAVLLILWGYELSPYNQDRLVRLISGLGKWSMLDVFVVAITIVIAKISSFASARPMIGIYFFAFSIFLAILSTMRIEQLLKKSGFSKKQIKLNN